MFGWLTAGICFCLYPQHKWWLQNNLSKAPMSSHLSFPTVLKAMDSTCWSLITFLLTNSVDQNSHTFCWRYSATLNDSLSSALLRNRNLPSIISLSVVLYWPIFEVKPDVILTSSHFGNYVESDPQHVYTCYWTEYIVTSAFSLPSLPTSLSPPLALAKRQQTPTSFTCQLSGQSVKLIRFCTALHA